MLSQSTTTAAASVLLRVVFIAYGGAFLLKVTRGEVPAILIPAVFFLSVIGRAPARPNCLIAVVWLGAASLVVGVISAAVALTLA